MTIKAIEFPSKEFSTKEEMFSMLKANEDKLISLKKAEIFKSSEKSALSFINLDIEKATESIKANFEVKEGFIYPVISTTNYMDSHGDVHFGGCFSKTVKEQQGQVYYALDHELRWNSILAWQKDVKMFVTPLDWALVGKNFDGKTEALVFEIDEKKITKNEVLTAIKSHSNKFENSIRMQYVKLRLAADTNQKDMAENKALFDARINQIGNKEVAIERGYFWAVDELKIHKEGSLVIAGGSNDATSIITLEADNITSEELDPSNTQSKSVWDLLVPEKTQKTVWDNYLKN